jgi:hypothetical protein
VCSFSVLSEFHGREGPGGRRESKRKGTVHVAYDPVLYCKWYWWKIPTWLIRCRCAHLEYERHCLASKRSICWNFCKRAHAETRGNRLKETRWRCSWRKINVGVYMWCLPQFIRDWNLQHYILTCRTGGNSPDSPDSSGVRYPGIWLISDSFTNEICAISCVWDNKTSLQVIRLAFAIHRCTPQPNHKSHKVGRGLNLRSVIQLESICDENTNECALARHHCM